MDFPKAEKLSPVYRINGELYSHVTAAEALENPRAIRANTVSYGDMRIWWFVPLAKETNITMPQIPETM